MLDPFLIDMDIMACSLELSSSSEDSLDVPVLLDPFLDYINEILMDEGVDAAAPCLQQVDGASYQAIFHSLQDIICGSASHEDAFDPVNGPDEYHVTVPSLPANDHPESNFQQESSSKSTKIMELHENKNVRYNSCSCLNSKKDAMAQNHHSAIKSNDGLLTDTRVSCRGRVAVNVEVLRGHYQAGQEQGTGKSKLPSADEQFSSKLEELEVSFEDLKLVDDAYTSLYVEELSSSTDTAARSCKHNGDKKKSMAGKGRRFCEKHTSDVAVFVDVREILLSCAQNVVIGNVRRANEILQELHQVHGASAYGTGVQRIAYIFSKALAARMSGMGMSEFEAMSLDMPSSAALLRATKLEFEVSPHQKIMHYFANQSILKAAEGASRLHIVDYGLMYGMQWPCLINALADREGGPPLLVITGIESPQPGINMAERLDESGRRLAGYAKAHNVPFQYHAIIVTDKWEGLDAVSLLCSEGEVLVVNCVKRLRRLADGSADSALTMSMRQKLLTCIHSLNPHLLVTVVVSAAHNSPLFVFRFREALSFYSNVADMLDTLWGDTPERLILERSYLYADIINIVACEGAERVERPETYKQWHVHITKAGFEQLPIPSTILGRSKSHVKQHYHKEFLIENDGKGWMLTGWKGRVMLAMSAWKPCGRV